LQQLVVLARFGSAEISALAAAVIFMAIMGYLLFSGEKEKEEPRPPKPRR
jgi:hypothetical protein